MHPPHPLVVTPNQTHDQDPRQRFTSPCSRDTTPHLTVHCAEQPRRADGGGGAGLTAPPDVCREAPGPRAAQCASPKKSKHRTRGSTYSRAGHWEALPTCTSAGAEHKAHALKNSTWTYSQLVLLFVLAVPLRLRVCGLDVAGDELPSLGESEAFLESRHSERRESRPRSVGVYERAVNTEAPTTHSTTRSQEGLKEGPSPIRCVNPDAPPQGRLGRPPRATDSAAHLVEERLVQRRVLPLQVMDLFVELGLYVSALHLKLFQCVDSSFYCFR